VASKVAAMTAKAAAKAYLAKNDKWHINKQYRAWQRLKA